MSLSGILLAIVGFVGLVGNLLVIIVYCSAGQRTKSTSIYLAALACSDFSMICTAMFLFVLEAWRHHGPVGESCSNFFSSPSSFSPALARIYAHGSPVVFPLGAVFQTTSIYFCCAAAVDCFISVVLPRSIKESCCTSRFSSRFLSTRQTKLCFQTCQMDGDRIESVFVAVQRAALLRD